MMRSPSLRSCRWRQAVLSVAIGLASLAAGEPLPEGEDFGAGITLSSAKPLAAVLAAPESFAEEPVLVRGRISDVCQRKGCWTILREGEKFVRVRFRDYAFFVPRDIQGREALVEGVVTVRTLSQREARHYAEETPGGKPETIVGPQREIGFVATGVRVLAEP